MYEPPHWTKPRMAPIAKVREPADSSARPHPVPGERLVDWASRVMASESTDNPAKPLLSKEEILAGAQQMLRSELVVRPEWLDALVEDEPADTPAKPSTAPSIEDLVETIKDGLRAMADQVAGLTARVDDLDARPTVSIVEGAEQLRKLYVGVFPATPQCVKQADGSYAWKSALRLDTD